MSVMNVKRGTQTWSKAEQAPNIRSTPTAESPKENVESAGDFQKAYGEQAIGDVLNKVADPNWVDPNKKVRATGNNQLDKDAFFKLMLTQMKNQDPTNPMQSHEMAAQLAQFSSLEQLNNINSAIEGMAKTQSGQGNFGALSFIGKKVAGDASKIFRSPGDTEHGFNFTLGGDADKVKVSVKDATGKVVRMIEPGALKKGANALKWNGITDEGLPARQGEYRFSIEASNNGAKIFANTSFGGRISGVDFTPQGPMVIVNGQSIRLADVKKIEDPGMGESPENWTRGTPLGVGNLNQGAPATPGQAAPLKKVESPKEFIPGAPEEEAAGNIESVPMAGGLLAKLQKETK